MPTLFVLSKTGAVGENYGWLVGSDLISQHASVAIETLLAQVVVVITSQTSVLTSNLQILIIVIVIAVAISVAAAFLLGKKREASA